MTAPVIETPIDNLLCQRFQELRGAMGLIDCPTVTFAYKAWALEAALTGLDEEWDRVSRLLCPRTYYYAHSGCSLIASNLRLDGEL